MKFEPFEDARHDWVGQAIGQIREAFFFNTPAIVSTHRVNYVGGLDVANRDRNLALLDKLLLEIQKRWPDVEYMSSDELLALISAEDDG